MIGKSCPGKFSIDSNPAQATSAVKPLLHATATFAFSNCERPHPVSNTFRIRPPIPEIHRTAIQLMSGSNMAQT